MISPDDLMTALEARCIAVWPEIADGSGVSKQERIEAVPWARLKPPFAVVILADLEESEEFSGLGMNCYEGTAQVAYVGQIQGTLAPLRTKIETLRASLLDADLTTGQVLDVTGLNWGRDNPINENFVAKNEFHRAASLTVKLLVGEIDE